MDFDDDDAFLYGTTEDQPPSASTTVAPIDLNQQDDDASDSESVSLHHLSSRALYLVLTWDTSLTTKGSRNHTGWRYYSASSHVRFKVVPS